MKRVTLLGQPLLGDVLFTRKGVVLIAAAAVIMAPLAWLRIEARYIANASRSHPAPAFLSLPMIPPARGWLVEAEPPPSLAHLPSFVKRVVGVAGDRIVMDAATVRVGDWTGALDPTRPDLVAIAPGVIPEGAFFLAGDAPDSLDSRYAAIGLFHADQMIGLAIPLPFLPDNRTGSGGGS